MTPESRDAQSGVEAVLREVAIQHQRIPVFRADGNYPGGQHCTGCDHLYGATDGPNSPRHAAHVAAMQAAALGPVIAAARAKALREAAAALDNRWYAKEAEMPNTHETSCWLDGHESAEEFIRDRAERIEQAGGGQ